MHLRKQNNVDRGKSVDKATLTKWMLCQHQSGAVESNVAAQMWNTQNFHKYVFRNAKTGKFHFFFLKKNIATKIIKVNNNINV